MINEYLNSLVSSQNKTLTTRAKPLYVFFKSSLAVHTNLREPIDDDSGLYKNSEDYLLYIFSTLSYRVLRSDDNLIIKELQNFGTGALRSNTEKLEIFDALKEAGNPSKYFFMDN